MATRKDAENELKLLCINVIAANIKLVRLQILCVSSFKLSVQFCNNLLTTSITDINSGNTSDYARKSCNIKFVYTLELQKGHESGFTIGAEKIPEIGTEVVTGVEAMAQFVYEYFDSRCGCRVEEPACKRRRT